VRFLSRQSIVRAVIAAFALAAALPVRGAEEKAPHFAALRVDPVNLRTGPGERYPIEWVYKRKGLPVEITAEFDVWRKVRDSDGTEGWVHQRMLAAVRNVVVTGALRTLRTDPAPDAAAVARAEPGVIGHLLECRGAWCRVEAQGVKGWLQRSEIWGVLPNETVQ
jgi:SH3-like domain-containing protein